MSTSPKMMFKRSRPGSMLLTTILLLAGIGSAVVALLLYQALSLKVAQARGAVAQATEAAYGVVATMRERAIAQANVNLGILTQANIDTMNTARTSLPVPAGFSIDQASTGFSLVPTSSGDIIPAGSGAVDAIPAQLRAGWSVSPWLTGQSTAQSIRVAMQATVTGPQSATETLVDTISISQIPPWQQAITTDGDADLEVNGTVATVTGTIRSVGTVWSHGAGALTLAGDVTAQNGVVVDGPGSAQVLTQSGYVALAAVTPDQMRTNPQGVLSAYGGRVRVPPSIGDGVWPTSFQAGDAAGSGECVDHAGACGSRGAYLPSVQLQYNGTGAGGTVSFTCGISYSPCPGTLAGVTYTPFPFTSPPGSTGQTWTDPSTGVPWQGLFYDPRRESRCSAPTYRTFRCPTNPYGFTIDLSVLPAITGGVLAIHASNPVAFINTSGFQEVVLLKNASTLAGPLSIVSDLPVYIIGNFNVNASQPAMVDAPLITVLPNEMPGQLLTAQAWDSTATNTPLVYTATTGVTIRAVLRSQYHRTVDTDYWGGTLEQIPSIAGSWDAVNLRVIGAIDGLSVPVGTPGSYSSAFRPYNAPPSDFVTTQPNGRIVTYDTGLRTAAGTPPGSWTAANVPAASGRSSTQQQNASGQTLLMRLINTVRGQP